MIGTVLVALIAALHGYILVLEMFWWQRPRTRAIFATTPEFAAQSRVMAANQGLYNGFLAAGLIWALWLGLPGSDQALAGRAVALFCLACVAVAGMFGAATVGLRILFVQTVPASLAMAAVFFAV